MGNLKDLLRLTASVAIAALLFFHTHAHAANQFDTLAINDPEAAALYERLLENPRDRSLNLKYATRAAALKDYEAAIPPLERILILEPDNAWLQMQIAIAYNALDSKAMAKQYLNAITRNPSATPDLVKQAKTMLSKL